MIKHDCFGYDVRNGVARCKALRELTCAKGECGFYKTKEAYREGLKKYPWDKNYSGGMKK